ncbi:hypothetical protein ACLOJK_025903, partial [Asimina triloba]
RSHAFNVLEIACFLKPHTQHAIVPWLRSFLFEEISTFISIPELGRVVCLEILAVGTAEIKPLPDTQESNGMQHRKPPIQEV